MDDLALFKAQLGEALLEMMIFFIFSSFFRQNRHLRPQNRPLRGKTGTKNVEAALEKDKRDQKDKSRHLTEGLGELCLQIILMDDVPYSGHPDAVLTPCPLTRRQLLLKLRSPWSRTIAGFRFSACCDPACPNPSCLGRTLQELLEGILLSFKARLR